MISRHLITSSRESTWKFDRPVLFLNYSCLNYKRKHIWSKMNMEIARPFGVTNSEKTKNISECRGIENSLLAIISNKLNNYHNIDHSQRYWKIILGNWLRRYIQVIFNRVRSLEQCINLYEISGSTVISDNDLSLCAIDTDSAIWDFIDPRWNQAIYSQILNKICHDSFIIEEITNQSSIINPICQNDNLSLKSKLKFFSLQKLEKFASNFTKDSDAFIINSYLPKMIEIRLNLTMKAFPLIRSMQNFRIKARPNKELRRNLGSSLRIDSEDNLNIILSNLLFELIPICFLEGFHEVQKKTNHLPWPKNPKLIFTSNSFDTDELFKVWAAPKIESGTPYFIGQHGNTYGTNRYETPSVEEQVSDLFLTWGWKNRLDKYKPLYNIKMPIKTRSTTYNKSGFLLLMQVHLSHYFTWDTSYERQCYFNNQKLFIKSLNPSIKSKIILRLHNAFRLYKWHDVERWEDFDPNLSIDYGKTSLNKLFLKSRLIVFSYDSTGLLETLSQNIPSLAFWENGLDHLFDEAIPYYKLLVDVGIIHFTVDSVSSHINDNWDDVETWWFDKKTQSAIKTFCEKYSRTTSEPISEIRSIFKTFS